MNAVVAGLARVATQSPHVGARNSNYPAGDIDQPTRTLTV